MALFSYYLLKDTQRNGFAWMLVIVTDDRQLGSGITNTMPCHLKMQLTWYHTWYNV